MSMSDDAFASLVAEDVKNKTSKEQRAYLELPENWNRWQRALVALSENLQEQLDRADANIERETTRYREMGDDGIRLLAEYEAMALGKRRTIVRFKFFVDQKLDEVTRRIELDSDTPSEREGLVEFLRAAISRHQDMMLDNDINPTAIDESLWATLDGKWTFESITAEQLAEP